MEFSAATRHFKDAFNLVARCVPTRAVVPIMQSVKLTVDDDGLSFAATDNIVSIAHRLANAGESRPAHVTTPGVVLLPKALIDPILKVVSADAIAFALDGPRLTVRAGPARWGLNTEDADPFPLVPAFDCPSYYRLAIPDFKRLIRRTTYAVDPASTRYALSGVLVESDGPPSLSFVATDGRMVATQSVPAASVGDVEPDPPQRIIPEPTLNILSAMLGPEHSTIDVGFPPRGSSVQFRFGDTVLTSRLCEGRFPDWRMAIPAVCVHRTRTPVGPFRAAIEQAAAIRSEDSGAISFDHSRSGLKLRGVATDVGIADVEFPIEWDGDDFGIDLGADYVLKVLRSLDAELEVACEFQDPRTAAVIRSDDGFFGLIMPMTREKR